eukprot:349777-Chlamydomonas_euryale.AAC.1
MAHGARAWRMAKLALRTLHGHVDYRMHPRCLAPRHAQLSINEDYASYMETTMQLATSQGVVLPPRSSATKNILGQVKASLML